MENREEWLQPLVEETTTVDLQLCFDEGISQLVEVTSLLLDLIPRQEFAAKVCAELQAMTRQCQRQYPIGCVEPLGYCVRSC